MPSTTTSIGEREMTLDARFDRQDLRDRPYRPRLGNLPLQHPSEADLAAWLPAYARAKLVLNQGSEGACTGFGLAAVVNYLLFTRGTPSAAGPARRVSPAMLYRLARIYDEWPGEDYDGSSCRGALKGWQRHGVCRDTLWPYVIKRGKRVHVPPSEDPKARDDPDRNWDVDALSCALGTYYRINAQSVSDMQAAIHEAGAVYVSGSVHEGWDVPARKTLSGHADLVRIRFVAHPRKPAGHAFALVGYNELGFIVQNSWGPDWGSLGFALLSYADWEMHGEDAWVFTLGVPRRQAVGAQRREGLVTLRASRFLVPSASRAGGDGLARRHRDTPPDLQPLQPDEAYRHTLVLDRGFAVCNDITAEGPAQAIEGAAYTRPLAWLNAHKSRKLLICVQGGLAGEADSIQRIRTLAPYALKAGLYPLFIGWRDTPLSTLPDMVKDVQAGAGLAGSSTKAHHRAEREADKADRLLEPLLRASGGALWGQMKIDAERASANEQGGARLMLAQLRRLAAERPGLELHFIGHSTGAILIGALLEPLRRAGLKVASLRLLAPACTARFALDHFRPAVRAGTLDARTWHIHNLSHRNELADSVGPYGKSLLVLASRALEDSHKMPLIGLDQAFDPATVAGPASNGLWSPDHVAELREWIAFWRGLGHDASHRAAHVLSQASVPTGGHSLRATHGCFEHAIDIMGDALGYAANPARPARVKILRLDA